MHEIYISFVRCGLSVGVLYEEKGERRTPQVCKTVWDYIDRLHKKTPIFYNYMFSPEEEEVMGPHVSFYAYVYSM